MRAIKIKEKMITESLHLAVVNSSHYRIVMNTVDRKVDRAVYPISLSVKWLGN